MKAAPISASIWPFPAPNAWPSKRQRCIRWPVSIPRPHPRSMLSAARSPIYRARGSRLRRFISTARSPARALELTQRYQLISRARAEQSLAFTEHYRSYVINYATGEDLVRAYVERAGQSEAAQWAAYRRVLSEPTLPKDLAP